MLILILVMQPLFVVFSIILRNCLYHLFFDAIHESFYIKIFVVSEHISSGLIFVKSFCEFLYAAFCIYVCNFCIFFGSFLNILFISKTLLPDSSFVNHLNKDVINLVLAISDLFRLPILNHK